ncbi:galactose mutarotase-like enzyme [Cupriavidus metallidurans]|jgi:galactose mutarotase-like enzyme|uniref:aldose epimerase family protein n=1 Tax=Cupriavidus TaxID=106589 RepID=UPI0004936035|nr:aldose epimerase [Cupriavidus metallidurans]KWW37267.1 hypothetical protein AU374_01024 [Cupriavidus metallidurans]MDE4919133.1 aldose epimerase [Cupriavidus metallidurans]
MPTTSTQRYQGQDLLRIGNDHSYLLLAPGHGGRLVRWVHHGQDILFWPDDADWSRVAKIRGGNPLLFPFIGRHFVDGEAGKWRDRDGTVHALPQHGFARDLPFVVTEVSDSTVSLTLTSSDATRPGYPYEFEFTVTYRLAPDGLEAVLDTHNTGTQALPYYAGHHLYFALPHEQRAQSQLSMPPAERMRQNGDGSLTKPQAGDDTYTVDDPRLQDTFHALRAVGSARLAMPSRTIEIALNDETFTPWYAVTSWTERDDSDFYCVEPWLGLPNAIHHSQGLRWIKAATRERAICRLSVLQYADHDCCSR